MKSLTILVPQAPSLSEAKTEDRFSILTLLFQKEEAVMFLLYGLAEE